jgi:hypothetical protein
MYIYLFNNTNFTPINFIIVRIINKFEYDLFFDIMTDITQLLIDNQYIHFDDINVFSLINEFQLKIQNIILPFSAKNKNIMDDMDDEPTKINTTIIYILQNYNCKIFLELKEDNLIVNNVDYNMNFLIDKYL